MQNETPKAYGLAPARNQNHRIDNLYACRELVCAELQRRGVPNVHEAWGEVLGLAMENLPGWMVHLSKLQAPKHRRPNKTGITGVDLHRGRYRARVWKGGKIVWCQSYDTVEQAAKARAAHLRQQVH